MRVAKIESVTVVQVIIASSVAWATSELGGTWVEVGDDVGVGWVWDEGTSAYVPPAAPASAPRTRLTRLEFRNRFTAAEKGALYSAMGTNLSIRIWLDDLAAAEYIELTDPATVEAVNSLEQAGLLATGRAATILEGI